MYVVCSPFRVKLSVNFMVWTRRMKCFVFLYVHFFQQKGGHADRYRNWYIHCFLAGGTGLMITSWVNVEHARLILPPHFVTRLAINGSKVFIGFDTMIQRGSVLGNHLFLRIFHGAWKPPLKCDLIGKGIHVANNGDIAANDTRNFSRGAIAHWGVWKYTM